MGNRKPTLSEQLKSLVDRFPIGSEIRCKYEAESFTGTVVGYRKGASLDREKKNGPEPVLIVDVPGDVMLYYRDEVLLIQKGDEYGNQQRT